jgi:cytochrome c-type biogenesis protein
MWLFFVGFGLAPDFELTDIYGETHHLSDFKGKKVMLLSWASW